ncbi:hypothetical protein IWX46DRAFT_74703 [Phyllosticta citricarpa]|uniref:Uncharacterized protein n=1 Tax=Phyllosticta citricarpa TaxID=55181 RepID=A0ABR1MF77_9PEZI
MAQSLARRDAAKGELGTVRVKAWENHPIPLATQTVCYTLLFLFIRLGLAFFFVEHIHADARTTTCLYPTRLLLLRVLYALLHGSSSIMLPFDVLPMPGPDPLAFAPAYPLRAFSQSDPPSTST